MLTPKERLQILAITGKIKKGKTKNPGKATRKIQAIRSRGNVRDWLGQ